MTARRDSGPADRESGKLPDSYPYDAEPAPPGPDWWDPSWGWPPGGGGEPRPAPAQTRWRSSPPWGSPAQRPSGHVQRLWHAAERLHAAAGEVAQVGTPAQVTEAEKALTEATRALHRLLADG